MEDEEQTPETMRYAIVGFDLGEFGWGELATQGLEMIIGEGKFEVYLIAKDFDWSEIKEDGNQTVTFTNVTARS